MGNNQPTTTPAKYANNSNGLFNAKDGQKEENREEDEDEWEYEYVYVDVPANQVHKVAAAIAAKTTHAFPIQTQAPASRIAFPPAATLSRPNVDHNATTVTTKQTAEASYFENIRLKNTGAPLTSNKVQSNKQTSALKPPDVESEKKQRERALILGNQAKLWKPQIIATRNNAQSVLRTTGLNIATANGKQQPLDRSRSPAYPSEIRETKPKVSHFPSKPALRKPKASVFQTLIAKPFVPPSVTITPALAPDAEVAKTPPVDPGFLLSIHHLLKPVQLQPTSWHDPVHVLPSRPRKNTNDWGPTEQRKNKSFSIPKRNYPHDEEQSHKKLYSPDRFEQSDMPYEMPFLRKNVSTKGAVQGEGRIQKRDKDKGMIGDGMKRDGRGQGEESPDSKPQPSDTNKSIEHLIHNPPVALHLPQYSPLIFRKKHTGEAAVPLCSNGLANVKREGQLRADMSKQVRLPQHMPFPRGHRRVTELPYNEINIDPYDK